MLGAGSTTGFGSTWADRGPRYYPYGNPADEEFYFWSPQGQRLGTYKSSAPGAANSAVFLKTDTTTQGTWKGVYGADGYNVIDDTTAYPSYATVTPASQFNYVWSASTSDVRGLQKAASATDRIAATWYGYGSYYIDLSFSDTAQHQVAVYCLDWDYNARAQTISVLDGATQAVLDSRNIANFANGQYLVWTLSGHVILRITTTTSVNAVISGLFFDSPTTGQVFRPATVSVLPGNPPVLAAADHLQAGHARARISGLYNAASLALDGTCSPGSMATLVGSGFTGQGLHQAAAVPWPTQLAGLRVTFNGTDAPIVATTDTLIQLQCPVFTAGTPVSLTVEAGSGQSTDALQFAMQEATPGLYKINGANQGAVIIAGTNQIAMPAMDSIPSRPAKRGEYLAVYA